MSVVDTGVGGSIPTSVGKTASSDDAPLSRSIPTSVGKTQDGSSWPWHREVHPHERGENMRHGMQGAEEFGPSPRAWGKHQDFAEFPVGHHYI